MHCPNLVFTYQTNELLYKMGKLRSNLCLTCQTVDNIPHVLLYCHIFSEIRQKFITDITNLNTNLPKYSDNEFIMIVTFLDPQSPSLPSDISEGWTDLPLVYQLCRDFCWNIHAKKEKNEKAQTRPKPIL